MFSQLTPVESRTQSMVEVNRRCSLQPAARGEFLSGRASDVEVSTGLDRSVTPVRQVILPMLAACKPVLCQAKQAA